MEYLSIYNDKKEKLPKVIARGTKLKENEHILITTIIIKNKQNKYLIQKTSKEKGSSYALTGGHVAYNETSKETIIRETKEELGLDISKDNITYITDIHLKIPIMDIYYLEKDIDLNSITLQKEEVESIMFLKEEEIKEQIKNKKFKESHAKAFNKFLNTIEENKNEIIHNGFNRIRKINSSQNTK